MASCRIIKDPDNTWYIYIDWDDWFDRQISDIGGTFTLTASDWFPDAALSEEDTKLDDSTKKTYFYGSGGTADTSYDILNRISYTSSTLGAQVFTEDRTITIRIKEK
jgi:hypothetical protein